MEAYKVEFIKFLLEQGALKIGDEWALKSKRLSPYFLNIGDLNDGESTTHIARAFAESIKDSGAGFDILYGIPEKGVALAVATSMELNRLGMNKPWCFRRKEAKTHGEMTNADERKKMFVGRTPQDGNALAQLDDVFTAGTTKYEERDVLTSMGDFKLPWLFIAADRQEVGTGASGMSAIEAYEQKTDTKVQSIITTSDIYEYLSTASDDRDAVRRIRHYLQVYGTPAARGKFPLVDQRIIGADKSVIVACDMDDLGEFSRLVEETCNVPGIGGYKVGFQLGLTYGLPQVVNAARVYTEKPIIYDHQKAATDIPDTGKNFAKTCKDAGIDAVILFPQAGPETERAWIYHALNEELKVIVGGRMTHPSYAVSEGGFITDEGALDMYRIAARAGIGDFVVPGNKPEVIEQIKSVVQEEIAHPKFYSPGFVTQGGKISTAGKAAGDRLHAIVGRAITQANDYRAAAIEMTSQLNT